MSNPFFYIGIVILLLFVILYIYSTKKTRYKATPQTKLLLEDNVEFYNNLEEEEQERFIKRVVTFLNEVFIKGVDTEIEELDKILVASSAVIPVFHLKEFKYTNLKTVLIYPSTFNQDLKFGENAKDKKIGGMIGTGRYEDQMILSKESLRAGYNGRNKKQNTGIHEFVHLIDKMDGETDGVPEVLIEEEQQEKKWYSILHRKMKRIKSNNSDIRKYGATNKAEFFAVVSEYFFNKPETFKKKHPKLYNLLSKFYKVRK